MKLEKLSKGRFIKTSIIVLVVISIFGVIFINRSKAKYRVTQSIQIVNGTVNYKPADFSLISINLQDAKGSSNYTSSGNIPTTGYKLNEDKTYCTISGTEYKGKSAYNGQGITINYNGNNIDFLGFNKANTKCYLYFDVITGIPGTELLAKYKSTMGSGTPNFNKTSCSSGCGEKTNGLYKTTDSDNKETYYFRGTVTNNWVKLGNYYWRIIRFNGNGSIRLIYSGNGSPAETGDGTQISKSAFNSTNSDARYVKFVYGTTSSTIKSALDTWYTSNLTSYTSKLDGTAGFCNDGDESTGTSYKTFPASKRITGSENIPTLACSQANLFTTSGNTNGNGKLTNPVGLITADEVVLAGGIVETDLNSGYYLYTNSDYWTMTPAIFAGKAAVFYMINGSFLYADSYTDYPMGVRPVINLKADTRFQEGGDGTSTNPYVVVI